MLIAALPVEALSLDESSLLVEGETQGAMLVLDQTGRRVHHHDPGGLTVDPSILADLPAAGSGSTYLRDRTGPGTARVVCARRAARAGPW